MNAGSDISGMDIMAGNGINGRKNAAVVVANPLFPLKKVKAIIKM